MRKLAILIVIIACTLVASPALAGDAGNPPPWWFPGSIVPLPPQPVHPVYDFSTCSDGVILPGVTVGRRGDEALWMLRCTVQYQGHRTVCFPTGTFITVGSRQGSYKKFKVRGDVRCESDD